MRRATLAIGLAAVAAAGCSTPPPNVVLVTVDTLRADRLGCYGYFRDTTPELDRLASECLVFERCLAPMATTFPAHLSLLTGKHPVETGAIANIVNGGRPFQPREGFRSLAQVLADAGYRTGAIVSATPISRHSGLDAGFEFFDQPRGPQRAGGETVGIALDWLKSVKTGPFFLWVHLYDPHLPYTPPPPWDTRWTTGPEQERYLAEREFHELSHPDYPQASTESLNNAYDGEVAYADQEIGRLLAELRDDPREWQRTVVVVVGDHGESLGQHGLDAHGSVTREQLRVPLLIRAPGVPPARVARIVREQDVIPTLYGLADLPGRSELLSQSSGTDRLAADEPGCALSVESAFFACEYQKRPRRYSLTDGEWTLLYDPRDEDRLYRIPTDPFELRDLGSEYPEVSERMRKTLLSRLSEYEARAPEDSRTAPAVDPETREAMRALGYVR